MGKKILTITGALLDGILEALHLREVLEHVEVQTCGHAGNGLKLGHGCATHTHSEHGDVVVMGLHGINDSLGWLVTRDRKRKKKLSN